MREWGICKLLHGVGRSASLKTQDGRSREPNIDQIDTERAYVAVRRRHSDYSIKLPVSYWLPGKWPDKWRVLDVGPCHLICFLSWLAIGLLLGKGIVHSTKLGLNVVLDIYSVAI